MTDRKTAFFIDDDLDFLTLLSFRLQHPLYTVKTYHAVNGYYAIDQILKTNPDIIFIDFNLPKANGAQIIPILKSITRFQDIPIFVMSAYPKELCEPLLKGVIVNGFLPKEENLPDSISKILDEFAGAASQS